MSYLLDSLDENMKNHAKILQEGKKLPPFDDTITMLETICNKSWNVGNGISWDY
jgi:hypothetical protein